MPGRPALRPVYRASVPVDSRRTADAAAAAVHELVQLTTSAINQPHGLLHARQPMSGRARLPSSESVANERDYYHDLRGTEVSGEAVLSTQMRYNRLAAGDSPRIPLGELTALLQIP